MLHDYHRMRSAIGGEVSPTGRQIGALLPQRAQLWLYRWSLDRGHLDTILDRMAIEPLMRLSTLFARLDGRTPGGPAASRDARPIALTRTAGEEGS
jgi:hypothetical protein